jgi:hypothetical protein
VTVEFDGACVVAVEFFDDGTTIWIENEFYTDAHQGIVDALVNGSGDWPGFGPEPQRWPCVILAVEHAALRAQLSARQAWVIEAKEDNYEDSIRRTAALIAKGRLRVHERCANLRREMRSRSWQEISKPTGKRRPDPVRMLVGTRISKWRLL